MHLVGFIIRIYQDARSSECQNPASSFHFPGPNAIVSISLLLCVTFYILSLLRRRRLQRYSPSKLCVKSLSSRQTASARDVPTVTVLCDLQIRNP